MIKPSNKQVFLKRWKSLGYSIYKAWKICETKDVAPSRLLAWCKEISILGLVKSIRPGRLNSGAKPSMPTRLKRCDGVHTPSRSGSIMISGLDDQYFDESKELVGCNKCSYCEFFVIDRANFWRGFEIISV
jgi:hypothetical protein